MTQTITIGKWTTTIEITLHQVAALIARIAADPGAKHMHGEHEAGWILDKLYTRSLLHYSVHGTRRIDAFVAPDLIDAAMQKDPYGPPIEWLTSDRQLIPARTLLRDLVAARQLSISMDGETVIVGAQTDTTQRGQTTMQNTTTLPDDVLDDDEVCTEEPACGDCWRCDNAAQAEIDRDNRRITAQAIRAEGRARHGWSF